MVTTSNTSNEKVVLIINIYLIYAVRADFWPHSAGTPQILQTILCHWCLTWQFARSLAKVEKLLLDTETLQRESAPDFWGPMDKVILTPSVS